MTDRSRNPGYSRFTQQLFMSQLSDKEFSVFQEKMYRFPGFYVQRRSIRQYQYPYAAHILGDVAEVSQADIENDDYYQPGDYIGKQGVERSYERQLRGEKGVKILLRDAHGRIQGSYQNGALDQQPKPGKNLTLSIDYKLQALGERLMQNKIGAIVAIEPSTGEVLCMVSSPTYDPRLMTGRQRSKKHQELNNNVWKPLLNRAIMGQYPPGSTFKTTQGLTFMNEGIITPTTQYPCSRGFHFRGLRVGCHGHAAPLALVPALSTSCNGYFCWGLYHMIGAQSKYGSVQNAINTWRDYMVSMGFGYKLGIDLPGEKRGLIPNALFTRKHQTKASSRCYDYVVQGMRSSVLGGTCRSLGRYDFMACGKTGTAQNRGRDHSVFMGFAPMDNPKIAVAVYVENGGWGADYGVPLGGLIMEQYIHGKLSEASEKKAEEFQHRVISYGTTSR